MEGRLPLSADAARLARAREKRLASLGAYNGGLRRGVGERGTRHGSLEPVGGVGLGAGGGE